MVVAKQRHNGLRERERERERESYLGEQQGLGVAMSNIGVMVGRVLTV